jgi:hypothetical protein
MRRILGGHAGVIAIAYTGHCHERKDAGKASNQEILAPPGPSDSMHNLHPYRSIH